MNQIHRIRYSIICTPNQYFKFISAIAPFSAVLVNIKYVTAV